MRVIKIECDLQLPHLALQESQFLLPQKVLKVLQVVDGFCPHDNVIVLHPLVHGVDEHVHKLIPLPEVCVAHILTPDEQRVDHVETGHAAHRAKLATHLLYDLGVNESSWWEAGGNGNDDEKSNGNGKQIGENWWLTGWKLECNVRV